MAKVNGKLLIVDDDASWIGALRVRDFFSQWTVATSLADGLRLIDKRRRWDAAIFDLVLADGSLTMANFDFGLRCNAGIILAAAFRDKFPDKRVVIASGFGEPSFFHLPDGLLTDGIGKYVSKASFIRPVPKRLDRPWETDRKALKCWQLYQRATEVSRFLAGGPDVTPSREVLDCFMLEPNIFGLGLNLREIIRRIRESITHSKRKQKG